MKERTFSVPEAARILGVTPAAVNQAIRRGKLKALGEPRRRKIPASELVLYAARTGRDPREFAGRLRDMAGVSWKDVAVWILAVFGIALVLKAR